MNSVDMAPAERGRLATVGVVPAVAAYWPALLLALAAVAQQAFGHINSDVSWLLTVSERLLDGAVPYVDFIETNPPASILLYLPSVALARAVDVRPEPMVAASVFALAAVVILATGRILAVSRLMPVAARPPLLAAAIFVLLILPAKAFAQREHIALLTMLPLLAVLAVRLEGGEVALRTAMIAGLGAGITVAVKPHFALALVLPALLLLWRLRSPRPALQPEWFAVAAVVLLYGASVPLAFPAYLSDGLPLVIAAYLPIREPLWRLLLNYGSLVLALILIPLALTDRHGRNASPVLLLLLAACGFFMAYLIQAKGFLNHEFPAVALSALAVAWLIVMQATNGGKDAGVDASGRAFLSGVLLVAGLSLGLQYFNAARDRAGAAEAIAALAPPHPRMIAVSPQIAMGHPLVRALGGTWVGRPGSLWLSSTVTTRLDDPALTPEDRRTLLAYAQRDRRVFAEDVRRGNPDVILFGEEGEDWVRSDPLVSASLTDYAPAASLDTDDGVMSIWLRRPAPQP